MNHLDALLALRQTLLGTVVAQTGLTTLASTENGFTRVTGSFVQDGFVAGMEVVPFGFADNNPALIETVSDLAITVRSARPLQGASGNRSLTVGIPPLQGFENRRVDPVALRWFMEEDYLPGPVAKVNAHRGGQLHHTPMYVVRLYGIANTGVAALYAVAEAVLARFIPGATIEQPDGNPLRVGTLPAPYRGPVTTDEEGRAVVTITIPLWKRTQIGGLA